jgi:hypothetical protein
MLACYLWLDNGVVYIVDTASGVRENSVARRHFRVEARNAPALNGRRNPHRAPQTAPSLPSCNNFAYITRRGNSRRSFRLIGSETPQIFHADQTGTDQVSIRAPA